MLDYAVSAVSAAAAAGIVLAVIVRTIVLCPDNDTCLSSAYLCIVYLTIVDIYTLVVTIK